MTVTAASFPTNLTSGQPTAAQAPAISSDFTMFLRMLTVQMQNQDPLNPIDSTDYAVQLATFSGVEQQVRSNQLLTELLGKYQQMGMAEMASWVGQEARSDSAVYFDGNPVTLSPNPALGASGAVIAVRDSTGKLVSREEIPVSAAPYQWLGADAAGSALPPGVYSITLESLQGDEVIDSRPIEHYARVIEARGTPSGTMLVLEGGVEVEANAVTALRLPQA